MKQLQFLLNLDVFPFLSSVDVVLQPDQAAASVHGVEAALEVVLQLVLVAGAVHGSEAALMHLGISKFVQFFFFRDTTTQ